MKRPRALPLALVAAPLMAAGLAASAAPPEPSAIHIDRYELVRSGDALEIRAPRDERLALRFAAVGLGVAVLGAAVRRRRRGSGRLLVLAGLGLAGVGGVALASGSRWRATPGELVAERFGGRVERWRGDEIEAVEVARRAPAADDQKAGIRPRRFEARVLGSEGSRRIARFAFEEDRDARALARELGAALGVEVRER